MGSEVITNEDGLNFYVRGVKYRQLTEDSKLRKTTDDEVLILKPPSFLRKYDGIFAKVPNSNVIEFGIAEGGSLLYFAHAFPNFKYVGIDLREPNEAFLRHIERAGLSNRVKVYYRTSQDDGARVNQIIQENFGNQPLGCVIDDASHMYLPSRHTFEITFHRLARNGLYCIEDWSWAHEKGKYQTDRWLDEPALTNLVFEITMLMPSTRGLIESIDLDFNIATVRRGGAGGSGIRFDEALVNRGKKLTLI